MKQTMKRLAALILALAMVLSLSVTAFAAEAAPETDGNAMLTTSDSNTVLYSGAAGENSTCTFYSNGDLVFSGTGAISNAAPYEYDAQVKNIVIEEGITKVANGCFMVHEYAQPSIHIPATLEEIEARAFPPSGLGAETVYIADMDAWCRCVVSFPNNNPGYGADHILCQGKEVTHVDVPKGVEKLLSNFAGWKNLKTAVLPSSVRTMGATFYESGLCEITLPTSAETLLGEFRAFSRDETMYTYENCGTFGKCASLKTVSLPGVKYVAPETFSNCTALKQVVFGSTVTFMDDYDYNRTGRFFDGCPATLTIFAPKDNSYFKGFTYKSLTSTITASNFTKTSSTSSQKFNLGVKTLDNAKLTYSTASKKVTIDKNGSVTIPAKYVGKLTIKITAAATDKFPERTKSITLTVNPSKTTLNSVTNAKGKKMTVKWTKNTVGTGYQIQYSTKKDFSSGNKSTTVTKNSTVSKTITGLTKGKTYYVRIRTYKTVSDVKYYSGWSAVKSVKISK